MAESMVDIQVEDLKRVELVRVSGRIDSSNAAEFDRVLKEVGSRKHNVVLELSGVEYISSAGLQTILANAKKLENLNGEILLVHLSGAVKEVFEISGFDTIFPIFDDREAALASL